MKEQYSVVPLEDGFGVRHNETGSIILRTSTKKGARQLVKPFNALVAPLPPMREQMARALSGHFGPRQWEDMPRDRAELRALFRAYGADINDLTQADLLQAADAVLAVLREPDEGMLDAAEAMDLAATDRASAHIHWQAMIDHISKPGEPAGDG